MKRAALFLIAATAAAAGAQDFNAEPVSGTISLAAGFSPDPRVVSLRSGGEVNAQTISADCRGFIANAPDVRLHYEAGRVPLILSVASSADTTLVVNAADGSWYCDDDSGRGPRNPSLRFNAPQSGRYEIWVGTYGATRLNPAQLHISETDSQ